MQNNVTVALLLVALGMLLLLLAVWLAPKSPKHYTATERALIATGRY
jgi:hypothetical protein